MFCKVDALVVIYPISTSNHNWAVEDGNTSELLSIRFLHQTTTTLKVLYTFLKLLSIRFLHQTTTCAFNTPITRCCYLSDFYIKPQLICKEGLLLSVVIYPISTSNHNDCTTRLHSFEVVIYPISTSNHNPCPPGCPLKLLLSIRFLHQTTT